MMFVTQARAIFLTNILRQCRVGAKALSSGNLRRKHSCQWARKYFIYPTQKWPLQTFSRTITQLGAGTGLRTLFCGLL